MDEKTLPKSKLVPNRLNTLSKAEHFLTTVLPNLPTSRNNLLQAFERTKQVLAKLGDPQNTHKTVHVAGTSGKGTVCYQIDAMLRAHDQRSGLLVSPHVYDLRERIQIDGQLISERRFIETLNQLLPYIRSLSDQGNTPHYFETLLIMGFLSTKNIPLDYIIVETGLGGRYDASNTISTEKYTVLTQIGLDHTEHLGTTYEQIAAEKSGILQKSSWLSVLRQRESVNRIFEESIARNNAKPSWIDTTGDYVTDDLLIALDVVKNLAKRDGWQFNEELAKSAVANLFIPGRFEKRTFKNNLVILDAAHNPQKLSALATRLKKEELASLTVVLALSNHKDALHSLLAIKPVAKHLIVCEFFQDTPSIPRRAFAAQELRQVALQAGFEDVQAISSPQAALQVAAKSPAPILVTGSFYLLGEIDKAF